MNSSWKKDIAIIWTGQFFSYLSSAVVGFATILWLSFETKSATVLAMSAIASMLPQALIGPFTGVLIDRWDRKKIMIYSDMFIALCSLVIGIMAFTNSVNVISIYVLLALRSIGSAFHGPSLQASIPLLAPQEELTRVSGINQMIMSVSNIAGPALGALLLTVSNLGFVMMFDVIGAIIALVSLLFIRIPTTPRSSESIQNPHVFREMKEGFLIIARNRGMLWLFAFSVIVMLFLMPIAVLFPIMTLDHFNGNAYQMSVVEVIWGVGMVAGGALLGLLKLKSNEIILINVSYIILGLTFLLSGLLNSDGFVWFVILTALGGISGALYHSLFTATVQRVVVPEALGRVFSLFGSVSILPSLIGLTATGFIADKIGVVYAFLYSGIIITLLGIVAMLIPSMLALGNNK